MSFRREFHFSKFQKYNFEIDEIFRQFLFFQKNSHFHQKWDIKIFYSWFFDRHTYLE